MGRIYLEIVYISVVALLLLLLFFLKRPMSTLMKGIRPTTRTRWAKAKRMLVTQDLQGIHHVHQFNNGGQIRGHRHSHVVVQQPCAYCIGNSGVSVTPDGLDLDDIPEDVQGTIHLPEMLENSPKTPPDSPPTYSNAEGLPSYSEIVPNPPELMRSVIL